MGLNSFFFDTYALFEVVHEKSSYSDYVKVEMVTTMLNLMELHYALMRTYGESYANEAYEYYKEFCVEVDDDVIKEANRFRLKNYTRKLSYIDCVGYILAKKFNVKFLTGDKQFEEFDNVEFVK